MNTILARKIFNGMREQARKEVTQDEWNKWTIEAIEKAIVEAEARGAKAERERCVNICVGRIEQIRRIYPAEASNAVEWIEKANRLTEVNFIRSLIVEEKA